MMFLYFASPGCLQHQLIDNYPMQIKRDLSRLVLLGLAQLKQRKRLMLAAAPAFVTYIQSLSDAAFDSKGIRKVIINYEIIAGLLNAFYGVQDKNGHFPSY